MDFKKTSLNLFKIGVDKLKEGDTEAAKAYFEGAKTANELYCSSSLSSGAEGIDSIKNDIARSTTVEEPLQEEPETVEPTKSVKEKESKSTKTSAKKDKTKAKTKDTDEFEMEDEDEIASTDEVVDIIDAEDEEESEEPVIIKDENGEDLDITYEYNLFKDKVEDEKTIIKYAKNIKINNAVDIYEKIDAPCSINKVSLAVKIAKNGVGKINKRVKAFSSNSHDDVYEFVNEDNIKAFVQSLASKKK